MGGTVGKASVKVEGERQQEMKTPLYGWYGKCKRKKKAGRKKEEKYKCCSFIYSFVHSTSHH